MAKIIERGLGSEDDSVFLRGYIIGPVIKPQKPTECEYKGLKVVAGRIPCKPANPKREFVSLTGQNCAVFKSTKSPARRS